MVHLVSRLIAGFCASLLLVAAIPAQAAGARLFAPWHEAADRFERLAGEAQARGELPRMSDPEAAALLTTLSDSQALLANRGFAYEDSQKLSDMLFRSIRILMLYGHPTGFPDGPSDVYPVSAASRASYVEHQAEAVPLFIFTIDAMAPTMNIAGEELEANPARRTEASWREAAAHWRYIVDYLGIALEAIEWQQLAPERRLAIAQALARNAPVLARNFSLANRAGMLARLAPVRDRSQGDVRAALDTVAAAFEAPGCTHLCAF